MKIKALTIALAAALGSSVAHAGLTFDPDGGPGGEAAIDIGSWDWSPTSFLSDGSTQAIANFLAGAPGTTFDVYTHASLIGTFDQSGTENTPGNLVGPNQTGALPAGAFEVTMILGFGENIVAADATGGSAGLGNAEFSITPSGTLSDGRAAFLEIFYDATPDASDLSGSGFNDGTLIFSGSTAGPATGDFTISSVTPQLLDQTSDADQWQGQTTVAGRGGQDNIPIGGISADANFFTNIASLSAFGVQFGQIGVGLPFITPNPADCFTGAVSGAVIGGVSAGAGCAPDPAGVIDDPEAAPGINPNLSFQNGLFGVVGVDANENFIAQTDFNMPFQVEQIPEPATLALFGAGLAGLSTTARRRRKKEA